MFFYFLQCGDCLDTSESVDLYIISRLDDNVSYFPICYSLDKGLPRNAVFGIVPAKKLIAPSALASHFTFFQ